MNNTEIYGLNIEDYEDLIDLRNAKEEDKGKIGISIDDLISEIESQI